MAFVSEASNLTADSIGGSSQVYLHDLVTGTTELVTRTPGNRRANGASANPALSYDGSQVAFQSLASNLLCERKCKAGEADVNLLWDVFVHDRPAHRTIRASAGAGEEWMESSRRPSLDDAGCVLTFGSRHPIDERDLAHDEDLFVVALIRSACGLVR